MVASKLNKIDNDVKSLASKQDEMMSMMARSLSALESAERSRKAAEAEAEVVRQLRQQVSGLASIG
jgi:hypothetical protein